METLEKEIFLLGSLPTPIEADAPQERLCGASETSQIWFFCITEQRHNNNGVQTRFKGLLLIRAMPPHMAKKVEPKGSAFLFAKISLYKHG